MMKGYLSWSKCRNACCGMVALLAVLLWVGNAGALDFLDGALAVHGKVITQMGWHLQDANIGQSDFKEGDLSMAQSIVDLEAGIRPPFADFLSFTVIGRYFKEWAYQLDGSAYDSRFVNTGFGTYDPYGNYDKEYNRNSTDWGEDVTLRECFMDVDLGDYGNLRLGKQQVTWGEADGVRLADIINPLNVSRHFTMESWEDIRIPLWMAYANITVPALEDFTFDLVFTGDYERALRGEPGSGSAWAFPLPNAARLGALNPFGADMMPYFVYHEPDDGFHEESAEYGIRVRYLSPWGMEFSAFYFRTVNDEPILEWYGEFAPPPAGVPVVPGPGGTFLPVIHLRYKKYNNFGFTFNGFSESLKTVLRGEFVLIKDQEFNKALPGHNALFPPTSLLFETVERDVYKGMLGFDKQVFVPFLNPHKSFFVSGQYFYFHTKNHEGLIDPTYNDYGIEENTQIASIKINTGYLMETLVPDILFLVSTDDGWWSAQPSLSYTTSSMHWKYTIGANLFGGPEFSGFGLFRNYNELYAKLTFSF